MVTFWSQGRKINKQGTKDPIFGEKSPPTATAAATATATATIPGVPGVWEGRKI